MFSIIILDTNIVIYIIKHRPVELLSTFNKFAEHMCISSIRWLN